jgi:NhaA family Na+:H+ antiporter
MTKIDVIDPKKLSGLLLIVAGFLALLFSNIGFLAPFYNSALSVPVSISFGDYSINKPIVLWINDGLMAVFFFLIGLEIKREVLIGELSSVRKATLPIIAAIGGIIMPAIIYVSLNMGDSYSLEGWAVPVATDIAFALGILALVGKSVPKELKILLLSIAIIDDVAAILIIAFFYTDNLSFLSLGLASIGLLAAFIINIMGVKKISPYILIGIFIWACVLKSGVHATLAGVLLAFCIPIDSKKEEESPLEKLERDLYPFVFFVIMPIFAFANAGVNVSGLSLDMLTASIPLGIILGLFIGKQMGVFGFIWLSTKLKITEKPKETSWTQIYGLSLLTGIGFTMSLFIGTLAYDAPETMAQIRLGVLIASFMSAILGYMVLRYTVKDKPSS